MNSFKIWFMKLSKREREKKEYQSFQFALNNYNNMPKEQLESHLITLQSKFKYRETVFTFVIVSLIITIISGVWKELYSFVKFLYTVFTINSEEFVRDGTIAIIILSMIFGIAIILMFLIVAFTYLRNTYKIDKEIQIIKYLLNNESSEGDTHG